ncbi:MAG: DNA repair exonuclease [Natronospirillum sp.]
MKFIHTADWQIGRQYDRFGPEDSPALAEARINTVRRIAELAAQEQVDAVLVAGDVFDTQTLKDRTLRQLFNALSAYTGPWIMIPGNHDAALAESVWTQAQRLGVIADNVYLAVTPEPINFVDQGFVVLPAPLTQRHTHDDLTQWFDLAESAPELIRLGIAHGCVQGILAEEIDSANPIAADRAERARLDYLALGDWHGLKQVNTRTWYSGTPEQDRFKSNNPGHLLLVEITAAKAEPQVTPLNVGAFQWHQIEHHLAVSSDVDTVVAQLTSITPKAVIAVKLTGQVDLSGEQTLSTALSEAEGHHRSVTVDLTGLKLVPTDDDINHLHADGYLSEVITELRTQQTHDNAPVARDALGILASILRDRQAEGRA